MTPAKRTNPKSRAFLILLPFIIAAAVAAVVWAQFLVPWYYSPVPFAPTGISDGTHDLRPGWYVTDAASYSACTVDGDLTDYDYPITSPARVQVGDAPVTFTGGCVWTRTASADGPPPPLPTERTR